MNKPRMLVLVAAVVTALLSHGCREGFAKPEEGPNTAYPCGVWGVDCHNGKCCPWAHICGLENDPWRRCSIGSCCSDGDPLYGVAGTSIPQREAKP